MVIASVYLKAIEALDGDGSPVHRCASRRHVPVHLTREPSPAALPSAASPRPSSPPATVPPMATPQTYRNDPGIQHHEHTAHNTITGGITAHCLTREGNEPAADTRMPRASGRSETNSSAKRRN